LYKLIKEVLPSNVEVIEDYAHPGLRFIDSGQGMMFDIYIPSYKVAFEYQGYQHYNDHYIFGDVRPNKSRDSEKRAACKPLGITIVDVPYWWQRDKQSIIAILDKHRPDILEDSSGGAPVSFDEYRNLK